MKTKVCVESSMADELSRFLQEQGMELELVGQPCPADCQLSIVSSEERAQGDLKTIYPGGWMECPTALALAKRLGISSQAMGKLLNHLKVKIRNCGLGCFK